MESESEGEEGKGAKPGAAPSSGKRSEQQQRPEQRRDGQLAQNLRELGNESVAQWVGRNARTPRVRALALAMFIAQSCVPLEQVAVLTLAHDFAIGLGMEAALSTEGACQERKLVGGAQRLRMRLRRRSTCALATSSPRSCRARARAWAQWRCGAATALSCARGGPWSACP
jgi:hypothetical protein